MKYKKQNEKWEKVSRKDFCKALKKAYPKTKNGAIKFAIETSMQCSSQFTFHLKGKRFKMVNN